MKNKHQLRLKKKQKKVMPQWQEKIKKSIPDRESIFEQVVKKFYEIEKFISEEIEQTPYIESAPGIERTPYVDVVSTVITLESDDEYGRDFRFFANIKDNVVTLSAATYEENSRMGESPATYVTIFKDTNYDFICDKFTELFTSISSWE